MNKKELNQIKQKALEEHIPIIMDDTLEVVDKILKEIKPKKILEIGTAVGYSAICFTEFLSEDGIIDTIEREHIRVEEAKENIKKMGSGILNGIKDFFGIHSPSRLFRDEVGAFLGEGMALGIGDGFDNKIKGVNRAIVKSIQLDSPTAGVSGNGSGNGLASAQGGIVVNQYNTYSQAHSRYELFKTQQQTKAAVRLAVAGGV